MDYIAQIPTHIDGIPCLVGVTCHEPIVPATWHDPAEGGEVEWRILDSRGRVAPWLERKQNSVTIERLINDYFLRLDR